MKPEEVEELSLVKKASLLREACLEYMRYLESEDFHPDNLDDYENGIFEAAMEFVFDENVWEARVIPAQRAYDKKWTQQYFSDREIE